MQPGQPDEAHRADPASSPVPPSGRARPGPWLTPPPGTPTPTPDPTPPPGPTPPEPTEGPRLGSPPPPAPEPAGPGRPPAPATGHLVPAGPTAPVATRQAGTAPGAAPAGFRSNLGTALAMFVLFPPFALPATIDAHRARTAHRAGEWAVADDAADESRRWSRIALVAGLIGWALLVCCGGSGFVLHSCGVIV